MASNYGVRAILALRGLSGRQLRFLLALETLTPGDDGWREAGTELVARYAGVSVNTAARARGDLMASGVIDYRPGSGRGHRGAYRMKVPASTVHLPEPGKVPPNAGDLPAPERSPSEPVKVPKRARKGTQRNAAASTDESAVLKPSVLKPSVLSLAREALAGQGATEREIDVIIGGINDDPSIRNPAAYLRRVIDGDGGRALLEQARRRDPRVIAAGIGLDDEQTGALLADITAAGITDPARALHEKLAQAGAGSLRDRARKLAARTRETRTAQEGPGHAST